MRSIALWVCFWTVVALVAVLPEMTVSHDFGRVTLYSFIQWWSWGLLAPVIAAVDERLPYSSRQLVRRVLVHLAFAPPVFGLLSGAARSCSAPSVRATSCT